MAMASLSFISLSTSSSSSSSPPSAFFQSCIPPLPSIARPPRRAPFRRIACFASTRLSDDPLVAHPPSVLPESWVQGSPDVTECISQSRFQRSLASAALGATFLLGDLPAFAGVKLTDEEFVQIWIAWGFSAVIYFIVIPLIVFNYLRLRWYKRKLAEAIFQFMLVFLFFPGMLLLAPFINFRRFPKDISKLP